MSDLFGSLDDDRPPVADAATREAVAARAAKHHAARVRRQRVIVLSALGAMIPVLAVLVFTLGHRDDSLGVTTDETSSSTVTTAPGSTTTGVTSPSPTSTTSTSTTAAPPTDTGLDFVSDIDFTSATRGFAIGTVQCGTTDQTCAAVRATTDGGLTWHALGAPAASSDAVGNVQIRFGPGADGYIFGQDLFVTHDGGSTWTSSDLTNVVSLEPEGKDVWALSRPCDSAISCGLDLWRSTDAFVTHSIEHLPAELSGQSGRLLRQNQSVAWILALDINQTSIALDGTTDGGSTWKPLAMPCPDPRFGADLTFVDATHMWLVCAQDAGAGQQGKAVFTSSDGGASWHSTAALALSGLVANIAAASVDRAFVALSHGGLMRTTDGGATWDEALPMDPANPVDAAVGPVHFVDPSHGWVVGQAADGSPVVWRTDDGGDTWTAVPIG